MTVVNDVSLETKENISFAVKPFGKKRESNIELFRIVVMFAIVAHHLVVNSSLPSLISETPTDVKSVFFSVCGMWGKTGINCFVLITGFFMCTSKIDFKKFFRLLLQIEFYYFFISFFFLLSGYGDFSVKMFFQNLIPVKSITQGFVSCFLVFWLLIPFLNKLVVNLDRKNHLILVSLLFFSYVVVRFVPNAEISLNYVSWFVFLYFVSSFIRLYMGDFLGRKWVLKWGALSMGCIALSVISVVALLYMASLKIIPFSMSRIYYLVSDVNAPLAFFTSLTVFMFFKSVNIGYVRTINIIAKTTFGVFLIHTHSDTMRNFLWHDLFHVDLMYLSDSFVWYTFVAVVGVFFVCGIADLIRLECFEKPLFRIFMRGRERNV